MQIKLRDNQVLWPSRLEKSGAVVLVKTHNSLYRFVFKREGIVVSGGRVGLKPVPAKIHGIKLISARLWLDRIMTRSFLEFNEWTTSPIKCVTMQTSKKVLSKAVGKWPDEIGAPWNPSCERF